MAVQLSGEGLYFLASPGKTCCHRGARGTKIDEQQTRRRPSSGAGPDMTDGANRNASTFTSGTCRGAVLDWWKISVEASIVLPLRLLRLAALGDGAREEARLMVTEKVEAHVLLARQVATGDIGKTAGEVSHGVARHYLGYVRANRKRLVAGLRASRKG